MTALRRLRSRALRAAFVCALAGLASCYHDGTDAAPVASVAPQAPAGYREAVVHARASVVSVLASGHVSQGATTVQALTIGSGVVVDRSGLIVTNGRLFEAAEQMMVALDDATTYPAALVGFDAVSGIALLKIDASDLKPIEMGDMADVAVGDIVLAIGNPPGVGQTVSQGIVGAIGGKRAGLEGFIETDAAVVPGGYGGALVDTRGRLIGITSMSIAVADEAPAIRLAIPVNRLQEIVARLKKRGRDA